MKPEATHVTTREGGEWIEFFSLTRRDKLNLEPINPTTVHSIRFEDGSVWDTVNGWRSK